MGQGRGRIEHQNLGKELVPGEMRDHGHQDINVLRSAEKLPSENLIQHLIVGIAPDLDDRLDRWQGVGPLLVANPHLLHGLAGMEGQEGIEP